MLAEKEFEVFQPIILKRRIQILKQRFQVRVKV